MIAGLKKRIRQRTRRKNKAKTKTNGKIVSKTKTKGYSKLSKRSNNKSKRIIRKLKSILLNEKPSQSQNQSQNQNANINSTNHIITTAKNNNNSKAKCSLNRTNKFSCYDNNTLLKLKTYWNARHPDSKINTNNPKQIWESLKNRLSSTCNAESCWLRQKFVNDKVAREIRNYSFAPEAPSSWIQKPDEWLSSVDIEKVMKQYENAYHCFEFIGPSPIDYDTHLLNGECVWEELCKFDINSYIKRGKFKIGMIFNLDKHYQPGSHWVSLFVNIKKGYIFYFDSTGQKPGKEIKNLVKTITQQAKSINMNLEYIENKREHQKGNNECGMYSLYAIISQLKDSKQPNGFLKGEPITDKNMNMLRNSFFNKAGTL